jgi:hypothetical protein
MPPPMSPQGSRAGLITAVVVLSILFVTSAIFAFYYNAEYNKADRGREDLLKLNQQYASSDFQQDPAFAEVMALRDTDPKFQNQSASQIFAAQRDASNLALTGTKNLAQVEAKLKAALGAATDKALAEVGVTIPAGTSLADAVLAMHKGLLEQGNQNKSLNEQLAATQAQLEQEVEQRKVVLGERDAKIAEQGKQLEEALAELGSRGQAGDESVAKIRAEADRAMKVAQQENSGKQKQLAERDTQILNLQRDLEIALQKVRSMRPVGTKENIVRQADGEIVRVPGRDNVFINLGKGDQISPGMTFEVYDRFSGVPAVGTDGTSPEGEMPQGKAAIEVVQVGPGQSECRIIRLTPGQSVIERDIISNLVYDKNAKYNFVVFGDFDLDQNQVATPGDADVIKRLITGWGGRLMNTVNVNTDFVVLGVEPEVPAEDENETATDIQRRQAAQQALDAYLQVRSEAIKLNIPVMNQNRFLYYVGYFEQSQR